MNTKSKGTRLERKVKQMLIDRGFFVVRQAASIFPDLLAINNCKQQLLLGVILVRPFEVLFIECKSSSRISKEEQQRLKDLAAIYRGKALAVSKEDYQAIEFRELKDD